MNNICLVTSKLPGFPLSDFREVCLVLFKIMPPKKGKKGKKGKDKGDDGPPEGEKTKTPEPTEKEVLLQNE